MRRLEGKVVSVTGGGSGIGRGAALRIAEEGGYVVLADKRLHLADDVVFIEVYFLLNLGGSLKATAKNKVTTARVRIRT